jgi:1-deoxy-D-xylulose-5-phosphate reductoisomerase
MSGGESRGLAILGSTGSIGRSALEVVRHHPDRLHVVALAAFGSELDRLERQAGEFSPELVAVYDEAAAERLAVRLAGMPRIEVVAGAEGLRRAAVHPRAHRVLAAIVGAAGLPPVHAAVAAGREVALANKESLVVAGPLLVELARERGVRILPVDSEHAALHQALRCGAGEEVRRLVLTASGGPFRERELESFTRIEPEEALRHPTWRMGAKISIDSATLMNKSLELIEAHYLFDVEPERIEVVVHPQSQVHSLVEFRDGSWIAQLSVNDMVIPIQYALAYPDRWANRFPRLEPAALGRLDFEPVDPRRFPALALARRALAAGPSAPAVLNAANEAAVAAFLERRIGFPAITAVAARVLEQHRPEAIGSLEEALAWDRWGRDRAREIISS